MKQKPNADRSRNRSRSFRRRHSLFRKYLTFGLVIVLTSFVALSVTMYVFVNRYWESDKKASLMNNARQVAQSVEESAVYLPAEHVLITRIGPPLGCSSVRLDAMLLTCSSHFSQPSASVFGA